jgi:ABC-type Fe3+ transport system substrate-binding protein
MTDNGKSIYHAVKNVRLFLVEIARMLSDCDRLMSDQGWESIGTASVSGSSTSINIPEKWIPYAINRVYLKEDQRHTAKAIAIILDDEWKDRVIEPVMVGSSYATVDEKLVGLYGWDHTWWWLEFTDGISDGKIKTVNSKGREKKEFQRFTDIRLFGWPMAEFSNAEHIKSQIIDILTAN